MPDFAARRIQTKDGYWLAAGSRNLVKGLIAHGEKDGAFGVLGRRTGVAIANRLRWSTGDHVNLLKLAIGIETHLRLSIRSIWPRFDHLNWPHLEADNSCFLPMSF